MKRAVAYIRVSTEEQAEKGYSLESQAQLLRDYARGHDILVVEEVVERESAYKHGRTEFARLVKCRPSIQRTLRWGGKMA